MCLAFSIDNVVLCMFSEPFKTYRTAHNLSPGNLLCASYVVFVLSSLRYFTVGSKLEQLPAELIGSLHQVDSHIQAPRHATASVSCWPCHRCTFWLFYCWSVFLATVLQAVNDHDKAAMTAATIPSTTAAVMPDSYKMRSAQANYRQPTSSCWKAGLQRGQWQHDWYRIRHDKICCLITSSNTNG